jgi:uncharacterized membrane protein YqaE (UPF0057 family)
MRYILAILLPPLAVLSCGKPFQAILNLILCLFLWIPGVVHALLVVHEHHEDRRAGRVLSAVRYAASRGTPIVIST